MKIFHDFSRVLKFNSSPLTISGKFKIKNSQLRLVNVAVITFRDGSVYRGMVKNNMMQGYGTMTYSTGDKYVG